MKVDLSRPDKEIVAEFPWSARLFESLGIDFCCEGNQSLAMACQGSGLLPAELLRRLDEEARSEHAEDWAAAPLRELMRHIVEIHHAFCREELTRLGALLRDAVRAEGGHLPELVKLEKRFAKMSAELLLHLVKEEQTLFPMIGRMEEASSHQEALPRLPFGTIQNPIGMMVFEHDETGVDLRQMHQLSHGFEPPSDAHPSVCALYAGLKAFEKDMHEHVFLENYVLFPRAARLEAQPRKGTAAP